MNLSINEIKDFLEAERLEYEYYGNAGLEIQEFCPLSDLKPNAVTWIKKMAKYNLYDIDPHLNLLVVTDGLPDGDNITGYNLIVSVDPKAIYFEILNKFFAPSKPSGISPLSTVETSEIGDGVFIGNFCYICKDVSIGNNVTIKNNVVIECPTRIGDDCVIESGVIIGDGGFGYYKVHGNQIKKVPDFGGVIIGDRVEIGANTCVSRGTLSDTVIEDDVKIGSLCRIAHNACIGKRCSICSSDVLGGSCKLEDDVYVAPGANIMNQLTIGRNTFIGIGSVVMKNVEANKVAIGVPAKIIRDNISVDDNIR